MADPLSISASIAGLITLAEVVFRRTFKYIKSVKEAPKEIAALSSEIGALYGILSNVHLLVCQLEGETFDSAIQVHYIHSCYQTFEKVKLLLDKHDTLNIDRRSVDAIKRRLTWPFTVSEAKSLIVEVERHKATLGLALTADGMTGLLSALSRQNELQDGVGEIKRQLRQRQEADTRIAIDRHRQKVLDSFGPCNPDKNHRMSLKLRHPGTGVWLTESDDFKRWLDTPRSKLWLRGIPGAGKTVLASSVIQEALLMSNPSVAVAFFYCDYKDAATQDPVNILASLARQLARQNGDAFEKLQTLYRKHFPDNMMTTEYEPDELRDLIIDMTSTFDSTLLLVDALDECGKDTSHVVELLASLNVNGNMSDVKTLFLSRDEQNIRDWLNDYSQISIAATSSDLKLYVGAEIENRTRRKVLRLQDPSLKEHILERLISGAEGISKGQQWHASSYDSHFWQLLRIQYFEADHNHPGNRFRWVTCQMDYLCELLTDSAKKKALDSLPPTLDATYARILRRVNGCSHEVQVFVQRSLRWIAHAQGDLSVAALCEAISINPGDTVLHREGVPAVDEILRCCSSLVRKSADGYDLEFAHFTVVEYLQKLDEMVDNEFGAYHIQRPPSEIELAEICLTYLNLDDFKRFDITDEEARNRRMKDYALRSYAVMNWPQHARENMANERVSRLTQQLFYPSKSSNFITWVQDYDLLLYEFGNFRNLDPNAFDFDAVNLRLATTGPLHYAAMLRLPELCSWLLHERCEVNQRSLCGTPLQCAIFDEEALEANIPDQDRIIFEEDDVIVVMPTLKILFDGGADPNCYYDADEAKLSLLGIVAQQRRLSLCLELLRRGAVVDEYAKARLETWTKGSAKRLGKEDLQEDDYASMLELMLAYKDFETMVRFNSEQGVSKLEHGANIDHLRLAAKFGQSGIINELLIDSSLNLNAAESETGRTALHYAAENGHSDIVALLLAHGADSTLLDNDGRTPIFLATRAAETRCLFSLLRQGCDISAKDLKGYTIVHHAAIQRNVAALLAIKKYSEMSDTLGCSSAVQGPTTPLYSKLGDVGEAESLPTGKHTFLQVISERSADGETPLHLAAVRGSLDVVHLLLDSGCDPNAPRNDGSTALHCVAEKIFAERSYIDIVNVLLERQVNPCHSRCDGATALHVMIQNLCPQQGAQRTGLKVLETLARQEGTLLQTNAEGLTVLHLHLRTCFGLLGDYEDDAEDDAARWAKMLTLLLDAGADLRAVDPLNQSALRYLVSFFTTMTSSSGQRAVLQMIDIAIGHVGEDQILIEIITDPALMVLAIKNGQSEVVQKLLDRSPKVDLKAATLPAMTPLQAACCYGCDRKNLLRLLDLSKARSDPAGIGLDLIHLTCQRQNREAFGSVVVLLEAGIDPSRCASRGENALMLAARAGNVDIVKLLIGHGVDPSTSDAQGCTVAHYALESGHVQVVYALRHCKLDWGAKGDMSIHAHNFREVTAVHLAAKHEDSTLLRYLIDEEMVSDLDCVTQSGETPLYIAVWSARPCNVAVLLSKEANANILGGRQCESPLHLAARVGDRGIVSEFLRHGCDVTLPNRDGLDCQMIALKYGFKDLAQMFAKFAKKQVSSKASTPYQGPNMLFRPPRASEALKVAIDTREFEICKRLVEDGADLESGFASCLGCTPLLYSLIMDWPEVAELLVCHGASITGQTCRNWSTEGYTPLHFAARGGHLELLKCLLNRGALKLIDLRNPLHPIHLAAANGHTKCVETMLDQSDHERNGDARSHGTSPGHLLINRPIDPSLMQWTWELKPGKALPLRLFSANPLQIAAGNGCISLVECLLERGALVNSMDQCGGTPLHFAATAGHVTTIKILLKFGANVHLPDRDLLDACMCAAHSGHLDAARELLKAGADRQANDIRHRHVLHHAALSNSMNPFFYLLPSTTRYELTVEDESGDTVTAYVLRNAKRCQLSSLLNCALPDQAYFPNKSNVLTAAVTNLHETTFVLKRLLKRLPQSLLPQLLSHQALYGGTPLYAASVDNSPHQVDKICILLDAGAALELEGGDHGTPLMCACATGRLSAIKVLVSKGAKLYYTKDGSKIRALDKAKHFPEIIRWLLVGRYIEGPRLLMKDDTQSATPRIFPKIAGYVIATRIRKSADEVFSFVRLTTI